MPSFEHKTSGQIIKAVDWNEMIDQIKGRVKKSGDTMKGSLTIAASTSTVQPKLQLAGGSWDVNNSEGDLKIGNDDYKLKIGLATGGDGAGDVRIRAQGGTNRLMLGGGSNDALIIENNAIRINDGKSFGNSSEMFFGAQVRQMLNLWRSRYGIGVQSSTLYFRTDYGFAWYQRGSHSNVRENPGAEGKRLMALNDSGDLILSGRTNPSNDSRKSRCRAMVDRGNQLAINYGGDYSNGVVINKLFVQGGNDVAGGTANSGHLIIGSPSRQHIAIDGNEIMAKATSRSVSTLHLQNDGGSVQIGRSGAAGNLVYYNRLVKGSSRRLKRNIIPWKDNFKKILQLSPRMYVRPGSPDQLELGYIAEEAESLGLKSLVGYDEEGRPSSFNYVDMCLYLLEIAREHERQLNPDSPYLKKYMEEDLKEPDRNSKKAEIQAYLDYARIAYTAKETKEELLKKIPTE